MAVLGSTVDPRLGAVNPAAIQALSQAGAATGQMYSNLGRSIAGVVQDQAQRKTDAKIAQIIDESTIDEVDENGEPTGFTTLDQSKFRSLVSEKRVPPGLANTILQDTLNAWKTEADFRNAQQDLAIKEDAQKANAAYQKGTLDLGDRELTLKDNQFFAGLSAEKEMQGEQLASLDSRLDKSLASQQQISEAANVSRERIASESVAGMERRLDKTIVSEKKLNEANNNVKTYLAEMDDATKRELGLTGLRDAMTIAEMNIGSEMEMLDRRLENATASDKRQLRFEKKRLNKTLAQNQKQFKQEIKLSRKELKQEGDLFREKLSLDKDLANQRNQLERDLQAEDITARFNIVSSQLAARSKDLEAELSAASERDKVKIRAEQKRLKRTLRQNLKIHNDRMGLDDRKISIEEALRPFQEALLGAQKGEAESRTLETIANTEMLDPSLSKSKMLNDYTSGLSAENKALFMGMSPADQLRNIEVDVDIAEASRDIGLRDQLVALHNSLKFDAQRNARMSGQPMPQFKSFQQTEQAPSSDGLNPFLNPLNYSPVSLINRFYN